MNSMKMYALLSTPALALLLSAGMFPRTAEFDEITVKRINVVDSIGKTRVILAGEFGPRRKESAGLLFNNPDGSEAGGLIYNGTKGPDGKISAGAILTFDQYRNDQIMAMEYYHQGDRKRQGLTIQDRPDTLSDLVKQAYRAVETAKTAAERDSLQRYYQAKIPPRDLVARRLFAGRDVAGASVITLSDPSGKPRLRMQVDSTGAASIAFLDGNGQVVKTIVP